MLLHEGKTEKARLRDKMLKQTNYTRPLLPLTRSHTVRKSLRNILVTCSELQMVKRYWNANPIGSVTLNRPNTQVIPNNGQSTRQARNTRL